MIPSTSGLVTFTYTVISIVWLDTSFTFPRRFYLHVHSTSVSTKSLPPQQESCLRRDRSRVYRIQYSKATILDLDVESRKEQVCKDLDLVDG